MPVQCYDAAIILGAILRPDGTPSAAMVRRVACGAGLALSGRVGALLMTGGATTSPVAEARVMRDLAVKAGVPPGMVHTEECARNTIENALFSLPLARQRGWTRLLVVTDSFHRPRARYIFARLGPSVTVMGVSPDQRSRQWWLAHVREAFALPWTMLRVEARRVRGG